MLLHLACFAVFWTGLGWRSAALGVSLYVVRMFAVTAGYHRYFSHRTFRTSRVAQFALAVLAQSSAQQGVLWWAAKHRRHHKYSDTELDVHSPAQQGFLYSHVGWIFVPRNYTTDLTVVRDLARFPELLWPRKWRLSARLRQVALGCRDHLAGDGLARPGGRASAGATVAVCWHRTFSINSLAHVLGRRRYASPAMIAGITGHSRCGPWVRSWHNNHHAYQSSVRQGFRWWEYDPSYYALCTLSWLGVVWDLHVPPKSVVLRRTAAWASVNP